MTNRKVLWQPQAGPQTEFHRRSEFEVLYGGARGGGKSDSLLAEGLRQMDKPSYRAILFRRTFPQLQEIMDRARALFPQVAPKARWDGDNKRWIFPSGSIFRFAHLQNEGDQDNYQGHQYGYIAFDELTHFSERMYMDLHASCRSADPDVNAYVRASANPGGIGHGWVKSRFIDTCPAATDGPRKIEPTLGVEWQPMKPGPAYTDPETGLRRAFVPSRVFDNRVLVENDVKYVKRLLGLPPDVRRAWLEGDWDIFAGQYYPEWRREIHVVEPFAIPDEWHRFRSLDYGLDCTACYWWAVAPDQTEYVYRELYEPNLSLSAAAERIVSMTPKREPIRYTVASPDLWNRRQDSGVAGWETMLKSGLSGLIKADDRRVPGWRELREHLKPYDDPNEGCKRARLRIFSTCTGLIKELPALVHDDKDVEDVSDKVVDHGSESTRYGVMSRPHTAKKPEPVDESLEGRIRKQIADLANPVAQESYW